MVLDQNRNCNQHKKFQQILNQHLLELAGNRMALRNDQVGLLIPNLSTNNLLLEQYHIAQQSPICFYPATLFSVLSAVLLADDPASNVCLDANSEIRIL